MGCLLGELRLIGTLQIFIRRKPAEQLLHLLIDVLGIAKWIAALRNTDLAGLARPIIDILEEMMMNRPVMRVVQQALWKRLSCTLVGDLSLKLGELGCIPKVELVLEDCRSGIAVRIFMDLVHTRI